MWTRASISQHGLKRRLRAVLLSALGLFRRHYLSGISFVVLSIALAVTLTSSSFSQSEDARRPRLSSEAPAATGFRQRQPMTFPAQPRVTYYIYEDEAQRELLEESIHTDAVFLLRSGIPNTQGSTFFVKVSNEAEALYADFLINNLVSWAASQGYDLSVVDLRLLR